MAVIGLTGGIASGKSTVANLLREKGARTIDADSVSRQVTSPGTRAHLQIIQRFGPVILDETGSVDRLELASIVFQDPAARSDLEQITHPQILAEIQRKVEEETDPGKIIVVEAALLVETAVDWEGLLELDALAVVASRPEDQVSRLSSSRAMSESRAWARIRAQGPLEEKLALADFVIENYGSLEELEQQTDRLWRRLQVRWPP